MSFPRDFTWGVSSAAYQIEGAPAEDGKGPSVWDMFSHRPGAVFGGHTGDVACDHYHRWREDVELLRWLGVGAYRFSFSWPRVMPEGTGTVNPQGMAFYDALIDALLEAGIMPWGVLFHWDYPLALFRRGGWQNPQSPDWFAAYAETMVRHFGDRVKHWVTVLEPACFIGLGLQTGEHAPGLKLPMGEVLQAGHHALLAHGEAAQTIRAELGDKARIGIVPAGECYVPLTDSPADIEAARRKTFSVDSRTCFHHSWWLDPVYLGHYPEDGLDFFGDDAPAIASGEMETIHQPLDFCALNYYTARRVRADEDGNPEVLPREPGYPMTTQTGWAIVPQGLYYQVQFMHDRYGLPLVVTENGHQNNDHVMLDGKVHDPQRIDYTARHLVQLERAVDEGIPVAGYFHWTLMDNFEWALGYQIRVGLVHTDYRTLKRTPKDSAAWYRNVVATNGASLHDDPAKAFKMTPEF